MTKKPKDQRSEGEGNRTAAAESAKAVEGKERNAPAEAELVGRRHTAEEDPEKKR